MKKSEKIIRSKQKSRESTAKEYKEGTKWLTKYESGINRRRENEKHKTEHIEDGHPEARDPLNFSDNLKPERKTSKEKHLSHPSLLNFLVLRAFSKLLYTSFIKL